MRCPSCGANNPDSAAWCSLCLAKLGDGAPAPRGAPNGGTAPKAIRLDDPADTGPADTGPAAPGPAAPGEPPGARPARPAEATAGAIVRRGDEVAWRCPGCDRENPIAEDRCPVCGTSLFQIFGPPEPLSPPGPPPDPRVAAALSVVPGAGHFYIRRPGEGLVRLVLAAWWLGGALVIDPGLGSFASLRILYLLAFLALAVVSAVDAYRDARAPGTPPLLSRKVVLWATTGLVAVSVVWLLVGAMAARG